MCGKNLNIASLCALSPVVHTANISSCQKNLFLFSCGCEQFHRAFGFLVINVCNHGEHYKTPSIRRSAPDYCYSEHSESLYKLQCCDPSATPSSVTNCRLTATSDMSAGCWGSVRLDWHTGVCGRVWRIQHLAAAVPVTPALESVTLCQRWAFSAVALWPLSCYWLWNLHGTTTSTANRTDRP